jgi:hypothetical protein
LTAEDQAHANEDEADGQSYRCEVSLAQEITAIKQLWWNALQTNAQGADFNLSSFAHHRCHTAIERYFR